MKDEQLHNWEALKKVFELIVRHLDALFNTAKIIVRVDGQMRQWYTVIDACPADNFENIHWQSITVPCWPVYDAPRLSFG